MFRIIQTALWITLALCSVGWALSHWSRLSIEGALVCLAFTLICLALSWASFTEERDDI